MVYKLNGNNRLLTMFDSISDNRPYELWNDILYINISTFQSRNCLGRVLGRICSFFGRQDGPEHILPLDVCQPSEFGSFLMETTRFHSEDRREEYQESISYIKFGEFAKKLEDSPCLLLSA